jgi:nitrite reductase (NADH) small subunit
MDGSQLEPKFVEIGVLSDIPRLGARSVKTPHGDIAVFRNNMDEVFALRDSCPHRQGVLSQGIVHGRSVTCPLHGWVISLETGEAMGLDEGRTGCLQVRVVDERIWLALA